MKMNSYKAVLLALILASASAQVHRTNAHARQRFSDARVKNEGKNNKLGIYFGITTSIEKHPYVVGININDKFACAGTIVSKHWVITLVDCTEGQSVSEMVVVAGSNDGQTSGTNYYVRSVLTHPDYDEDTQDYDYSLLRIDGTFSWGKTVQPVYLATEAPKSHSSIVVSGFGETSDEGDGVNGQIHQGVMKWQTKSDCQFVYGTITQRMGCAYSKGKVTICYGDYGDPLVKNNTLYGFFISGMTNGFCTNQALPTLVATIYPVADWIKNATGASLQDQVLLE